MKDGQMRISIVGRSGKKFEFLFGLVPIGTEGKFNIEIFDLDDIKEYHTAENLTFSEKENLFFLIQNDKRALLKVPGAPFDLKETLEIMRKWAFATIRHLETGEPMSKWIEYDSDELERITAVDATMLT